MKTVSTIEGTHFMNVDLEVISRAPLESLVAALGKRIFELHVGRVGRHHGAFLELGGAGWQGRADPIIVGFVRLIEHLAPGHRRVWNSAIRREFNIGIEAGLEPRSFELKLKPSTVAAIVRVGGTIVVTVYAPQLSDAKGPSGQPLTGARSPQGRITTR